MQLMAEKWGGRVMPLGSPEKLDPMLSGQSGGPRLHQVQEEYYSCPRSPLQEAK